MEVTLEHHRRTGGELRACPREAERILDERAMQIALAVVCRDVNFGDPIVVEHARERGVVEDALRALDMQMRNVDGECESARHRIAK